MRAPLAIALALAAALTACSSSASHSSAQVLTGVHAASVESATGMTEVPYDMHVKTMRDTPSLVGPHYSLGLSWIATGRELGTRTARDLGVQPVRAAAGQELVFALISPRATSAAFKPKKPATASVLVDGAATPVQSLPLTDSEPMTSDTVLIMVGANPRSSVRLEVTDSGRRLDLDLRTGAVSGQGGFTQRDSDVKWRGDSPVVLPNSGVPSLGSGKLSLSNHVTTQAPFSDHATLTNYQGGKWAPPGRAFLTLPLPSISCDAMLGMTYSVKFNDSTAFSFTPQSGGKTVRAEREKRQVGFVVLPTSTTPAVVFPVPDKTTGGTVTFDIRNAQVVDAHDKGGPWVRPPGVFKLKLAFDR
jgi:hypothetical protein